MVLEGDSRVRKQMSQEYIEKLQKAAELGDPDAQFELGRRYLNSGQGVQRNSTIAAEWFHKASAKNHREALYYLGEMYFCGSGNLIKDRQTAFDLIHRAAEKGETAAFSYLSEMYLKGQGVEHDCLAAFMWRYIWWETLEPRDDLFYEQMAFTCPLKHPFSHDKRVQAVAMGSKWLGEHKAVLNIYT